MNKKNYSGIDLKAEKIHLIDGYKKTLDLPINHNAEINFIFNNSAKRSIEPLDLLIFKNVYISSESIIFKKLSISKESIHHQTVINDYSKLSKRIKFFRRNYLKYKTIKVDNALFVSDAWSQINYYHWFAVLARISLALPHITDNTHIIIPEGRFPLKKEIMLNSIKAFGIAEDRIIFITTGYKVKAKKLIMPSHIGSDYDRSDLMANIKNNVINHHKKDLKLNLGEKIYISRSKAMYRKIDNEHDVVKKLKTYNFVAINMEDYSLLDQISIISNAKFLVSIHGAGITNCIFMKDGGGILELMGKNSIKDCFYILATSIGLRYFCQLCQDTSPESRNSDITVDMKDLEQNLKLMMGF